MAVGDFFVSFHPFAEKRRQKHSCDGLIDSARAGAMIEPNHVSNTAFARRNGHDRVAGVSIEGLELMNVCEVVGGLKSQGQLEAPAEGNGIVEKTFQIRRGGAVGFDFEALPVESDAAVVVGSNMHVKDKDRFPKIAVRGLSDVGTEIGMGAI